MRLPCGRTSVSIQEIKIWPVCLFNYQTHRETRIFFRAFFGGFCGASSEVIRIFWDSDEDEKETAVRDAQNSGIDALTIVANDSLERFVTVSLDAVSHYPTLALMSHFPDHNDRRTTICGRHQRARAQRCEYCPWIFRIRGSHCKLFSNFTNCSRTVHESLQNRVLGVP